MRTPTVSTAGMNISISRKVSACSSNHRQPRDSLPKAEIPVSKEFVPLKTARDSPFHLGRYVFFSFYSPLLFERCCHPSLPPSGLSIPIRHRFRSRICPERRIRRKPTFQMNTRYSLPTHQRNSNVFVFLRVAENLANSRIRTSCVYHSPSQTQTV